MKPFTPTFCNTRLAHNYHHLTLQSMPFVLPFMALVALAIKLDRPGLVFFVQKRVGLR